MFQAPRPGPGRPPSSTSTSEPPQSTTPGTSPTGPAESLTSQEPDWSTRSHLGDDEPRPASSTSGGSLGSEVGAEAQSGLRGGIAAGIVNATEAAHNILTDDVGRHLDQFRATETEIMEISDAGARIISRKLPPGVGNKDFEDILRVGMAVASYVGRQVRIMRQASAARRQLNAAAKPSAEQAV
jgi:hypothetical protein